MRTAELTGVALDWAVAKCEGRTIRRDPMAMHDKSYWIWEETPSGNGGILIHKSIYLRIGGNYSPSTDWSQGGPIIEREELSVAKVGASLPNATAVHPDCWCAHKDGSFACYGTTPLEAAMRSYVASKLGNEVEISKGVLTHHS